MTNHSRPRRTKRPCRHPIRIVFAALAVFVAVDLASAETVQVSLDKTEQTQSRDSFFKIWKDIFNRSPQRLSADAGVESARVGQSRTDLHWAPRLRAEMRVGQSDQSTMFLMNQLGARQVQAQDFNSAQLNSPGQTRFTQGTLGIELPLYEGGQGVASARAAEQFLQARHYERMATHQGLYAEALNLFLSYQALVSQDEILRGLQSEIRETLDKYRLGDKSNPVGYAGSLALKSSQNFVQSAREGVRAQLEGTRKTLGILAGRSDLKVDRDEGPIEVLLKEYLGQVKSWSSGADPNSESLGLKSTKAYASAAAEAVERERARYLPHAGLFGQTDMTQVDRGTGSGVTAGIYLRWSLAPTELQAAKEARLEASRLTAQSEIQREREQTQRSRAELEASAARSNYQLLKENEKLATEQWRVAQTLFRNGSLSAVQLADMMGRRIELVRASGQAEQSWIQEEIKRFLTYSKDVGPEGLGSQQ